MANIKVFVRIKHSSLESPNHISTTTKSITIDGMDHSYDRIFSNTSQQDIFNIVVKDMVIDSLQGYNCTIFAYGQTGSGKTYTIQGTSNEEGIVPRTLNFLYNHPSNAKIKISFIEVYNENIFDLLDPVKKDIQIREDLSRGVLVDGVVQYEPIDYEDSMRIYENGIKERKTATTSLNRESSRSHSIFTIYLESESEVIKKHSRLCIIDLAGSERLRDEEMTEIKRRETANINKSLLCLGKVISKLSLGNECHVNYRDSKLTFILKDSLGGNSKLAVIGNINPDKQYTNESINTLKFLKMVKKIKNNPVINSDIIGDVEDLKAEIRNLDKENEELKFRLAMMYDEKQSINTSSIGIFKTNFYPLMEMCNDLKKSVGELEDLCKKLIKSHFNRKGNELVEIQEYYNKICKERSLEIENLIAKKRKFE
ncbi:Kinesin-like protein KIF15 [Astathelohania contejeani]|uniref:Kinesin-like protein n=1 Tax=Astathelohania contejeani TaxID=164912 RepID=A0ABQ7HZD1_9MICR|nr:Kinesin-like protein KIF15 [Thelohania contejeani]